MKTWPGWTRDGGVGAASVVEGADDSLRVCGGRRIDRMAFAGELGVIWVTLIEMLAEG